VKRGNDTERVMIFGGGYDDSVDDIHAATESNGNSIYMIDADGDLVWSASHPDMKYGIPSDVRVIDSDGDSLADRMYVGDLGGQLWRIDFDDVSISHEFEITKFATFGDEGENGYQPFFYPPSVTRDTRSNKLLISIGSGNRDNPVRDLTQSNIFTIYDENSEKGAPPSSFTTITRDELVDATDIAYVSQEDLSESKGWLVQLENNEFNSDPIPRFIELEIDGIPPEPYTLIPQNTESVHVYVGNEKKLELSPTIDSLFWYSE